MENKISSSDERHLTNAIENAAVLAKNDSSRDRNKLLADELKKEGVDSRFAKVASCAFNKRFTVMHFKETPDEHKAEPFELTDGDKVQELMTGDSLEKAASVEVPFEISVSMPAMEKAASAAPERKPWEDTVSYDQLVRHVENVMTKQAAAIYEVLQKQRDVEQEAGLLADELADYFVKNASADYEFSSLVNHYGDRFQNAMQNKLPEETDWSRSADDAVLFGKPVFDKVAKLIEKYEASENLKFALEKYGEGLTEFCKSAGVLGNVITKLEAGLLKSAAPSVGVELAKESIPLAGAVTQVGIGAGDSLLNGIYNTTGNAISNAYAMYQAGNAAHMAPHEILDADFLTKDRYRDRLLGWSDMTADSQFSMYPAEQVFLATQKAMDMDTTLERPDKREVLRAYVAQLLAQNNRLSTADISALAQTLRGLADADEHGGHQMAVSHVKTMEETRAPELPALKPVIEGRRDINVKEDVRGALDTVEKLREGFNKEVDKANEAESKEHEAQAKAEQERAKAELDQQKAIRDARDARMRFLTNTMNIRVGHDPATGALVYQQLSVGQNPQVIRTYDQTQMNTILQNATRAGIVPAIPR